MNQVNKIFHETFKENDSIKEKYNEKIVRITLKRIHIKNKQGFN